MQGDLGDRAALAKVFAGADGVFAVTQPWSADYKSCDCKTEIAQGKAIADAAADAKARAPPPPPIQRLGARGKGVFSALFS